MFSKEDIEAAKKADIREIAKDLGYTPRKVGNYYTLKEIDSVRIFNGVSWYRFSGKEVNGITGGSAIDFVMAFGNKKYLDAIKWILSFNRPSVITNSSRSNEKHLVLPKRAEKFGHLYGYLIKTRNISIECVDFFVKHNLIYEEASHNNIVFLGRDEEGKVRFASMRGTDDRNGKRFRCDVSGSDKRYGFNLRNADSDELIVFEAAIDMMSYCSMTGDYESNFIALGMLHDAPLEEFLRTSKISKIKFGLDNDEPGRKACEQLMEKYYGLGYETERLMLPEKYKDWNEAQKDNFLYDNGAKIIK